MPTLYLLRHAKSSWGDPELPDHDRPLAPRGERAAALIGEHLRSAGIAPALVLCSSAVRARETLDRVAPEGELRIEPELYGAEEHDLLERVRLLPSREGEALADLHRKFPTAALVTLGFEGEWDQLGPGVARLEGFVRPRDLG
jgi:phosphohistidine phosphatase